MIMTLLLIFLLIIITALRLNLKEKIASGIGNNGTKDVKVMASLKNLSNIWRTLLMPFINCKINLFLNLSANCFITYATINKHAMTFKITDTKLYILYFKRTINWNKYQSKVAAQEQNRHLDYLGGPSF